MKTVTENKTPEVQIISLKQKRRELGACRHNRVLVDGSLNYVECNDCGEKLDPIDVLSRFASEESNLLWLIKQNNIQKKKLEEKKRVKCQNCGKMTPVNIKLTWEETHRPGKPLHNW